MLKLYGYKRCGTCRKAEKYFEEKGVEVEFTDITVSPPSQKTLKEIIALSDKPIDKFYNTSGVKYKEGDIKTKRKSMTIAEQIKMLASDGYLLKRPIVTDGNKATVGFKEEEYQNIWK
jgi:arsenate reductase (glutaredoxin)